MRKEDRGLSTWEWLTLIGVLTAAAVSVTAFALNSFEPKGSSAAVKAEVGTEIQEVKTEMRENQRQLVHFMIEMGVRPLPKKP